MTPFREANGRVTLSVHVVPRASRNEAAVEGDVLKIRLMAPPVEGKANEALIKYLAALLDVPRSSVEVMTGQSSRHKVVAIRGVTARQVEQALAKRN